MSTVEELVTELRGSIDSIAATLMKRLLRDVPSYRAVDEAILMPELAHNIDVVLEGCLPGRPVDPVRLRAAEENGARRARDGVPLDDLLQGWRIGLEVAFDHAQALAHRWQAPDRLVIEFTRDLLHASDLATSATASGHRRSELSRAVATSQPMSRLVRALLLGEGARDESPGLLDSYGFDVDEPLTPLCAANTHDRSLAELTSWLGASESHPRGAATIVGRHIIGFLREHPSTAPAHLIGLGQRELWIDLPQSFALARRVFSTAETLQLTGLQTIDDLGPLIAIHSDAELGSVLERRYITPVLTNRAGETLIETVQAFLDHRFNHEAAARSVFVHANTVRYRVRKFESLTGADFNDPWKTAEVCWALQRYRLVIAQRPAGESARV